MIETLAPQRLADGAGGCSSCVVDQPDTPVLPQIPTECNGGGCALPTHPGQRAAFSPIIVADCGGSSPDHSRGH
jgi:hypothetical protein